jgi:hypothetical protein
LIRGEGVDWFAAALRPCEEWALRTRNWEDAQSSQVCAFEVLPTLTQDEEEALGGPEAGSWLERGIQVTHANEAAVSFYEATAWFTAGAAHSNAELRCRTRTREGDVELSEVLPRKQVRRVVRAVNDFLLREAEVDERASGLPEIAADHPDVLVGPDQTWWICLPRPTESDDGVVERIRVALRP